MKKSYANLKPEEYRDDLWNWVIFFVIGFAISVIGVTLGLFTFKAIESQLYRELAIFYWVILGVSALALTGLLLRNYFRKDEKKFGFAFIHNPKYGALYQIFGLKWKDKGLLASFYKLRYFITFCVLLFSIMGLAWVTQNTFFHQAPIWITEQQITPLGDFILSIEPASFAESILDILILMLLWSILRYIIKNFFSASKLSKAIYWVVLFTIFPILNGLTRVLYHLSRYQNIEVDLFNVALGGFIETILIVFLGSVLIYYIGHFINNLLYKANELYSDERIFFVAIAILGAYLAFIFLWSLFLKYVAPKIKPTKLESA